MKTNPLLIAIAALALLPGPAAAKHHNNNHYNNSGYYDNSSYGGSSGQSSQSSYVGSNSFTPALPLSAGAVPAPAMVSQELSGEELFQTLHKVTANHRSVGYKTAGDLLVTKVDAVEKDGRKGVVCFYSNVFVPCNGSDCRETGDANGDGTSNDFVNVEHVWPQSFFNKNEPMRSDMHHLLPTLSVPNGHRSNMPFGVVPPQEQHNVDYTTNSGSMQGDGFFEPNNSSKGNVARAMLYFALTYTGGAVQSGAFNSNEFWRSKVDMLLAWNRQDPPDAEEKHRNDVIASYQGNRNPFIDDPSLADKIGAEVWKKAH